MHRNLQRTATYLLAVFLFGAVAAPIGHDLSHVHSLEHSHGRAAADFSLIAVGPGGIDAVDFYVEERTPPHILDCDLCARLALSAPVLSDHAAPFRSVDRIWRAARSSIDGRTYTSCQIRAPPSLS